MLRGREAGKIFLCDVHPTRRMLRIVREMRFMLYVTVECRVASADANEKGTGEMGPGGCVWIVSHGMSNKLK